MTQRKLNMQPRRVETDRLPLIEAAQVALDFIREHAGDTIYAVHICMQLQDAIETASEEQENTKGQD